MQKLPPEIISEALRCVLFHPLSMEQIADLSFRNAHAYSLPSRSTSVLGVCSTWFELGIPLLLETIDLSSPPGWFDLDGNHDQDIMPALGGILQLLHRRPALAMHIRRIMIHWSYGYTTASVAELLEKCSQVEALGLFVRGTMEEFFAPINVLKRLEQSLLKFSLKELWLPSQWRFSGPAVGQTMLDSLASIGLQKVGIVFDDVGPHVWIRTLHVPVVILARVGYTEWEQCIKPITSNEDVRVLIIMPFAEFGYPSQDEMSDDEGAHRKAIQERLDREASRLRDVVQFKTRHVYRTRDTAR